LETTLICFARLFRNIKEILTYPVWIINGKHAPDNHLYKLQRIKAVAKKYSCNSFIETGTFYGQTINAIRKEFKDVLSAELYEPLYEYNKKAFSNIDNVTIYLGDSSSMLTLMIKESTGRILFWLDGHYSGNGTACGDIESPILTELDIIKNDGNIDHCILIDDARLFTGTDGYPTLDETFNKILEINPKYQIAINQDCIVATPMINKLLGNIG
jgi:hypothetical protein